MADLSRSADPSVPQSKSSTEKFNLTGRNSGCIHVYSEATLLSIIGFCHFPVTKIHDTANLIHTQFEECSAQWLQVLKSCFCLFCYMWQIFTSLFLASGIHMSAALPKANTTNSVTLNMYDNILTFCQKSVTPMHKVALSIHMGCCDSLNLSFLTMISDMSHRSDRQFEESLCREKCSRKCVSIAL